MNNMPPLMLADFDSKIRNGVGGEEGRWLSQGRLVHMPACMRANACMHIGMRIQLQADSLASKQ
jgi:hypothetical protein